MISDFSPGLPAAGRQEAGSGGSGQLETGEDSAGRHCSGLDRAGDSCRNCCWVVSTEQGGNITRL